MNRLLGAVLPFLLLAAVAYSVNRFPLWPGRYGELVPWGLNLLGITGMLLAWHFHKSRQFMLLVLTLLVFNLLWRWPHDSAELIAPLGLLVPPLFLLLALLPERSLFTWRAWPHYLVWAVGLALMWAMWALPDVFMSGRLFAPVFPPRYTDWSRLPQIDLALAAAFLVALVGLWLTRPVFHRAQQIATLLALVLSIDAMDAPAVAQRWIALALVLQWLAILHDTYRMAYIDELTELPGRRALREQFQRLGQNYSIAMLDVDHFKRFNDRFGHDVGDNVLRMIASRMKQIGGGGRPFRYGGEEFTLVFPNKNVDEIRATLETFRQQVAATPFRIRRPDRRHQAQRNRTRPSKSREVKVTVSIGAAQPSESSRVPWSVLKAADKALYRAKRKGRNCVVGS